ncbi:efflux RND transporter periplasmic adaptor subunit [Gilvimarinus agarilyticus]|uniref:efflux RND transporter periplasmic adaptor subunit n=1 Tax=Gilvimarinus agarilyticus TaxID=679259 RepID=UPI000697EF43|nr:efflux RND transporter periplasmic adaptor subunit [Gilvimarinus agarilyticus]
MIRLLCLILIVLNTMTAMAANDTHEREHAGDDKGEQHLEGQVSLPLDVFNELGGKLATASPGRIRDERALPAEVRLNAEAVAHLTPRFAAQITEVNASTGDTVTAGQVLARAENSDTLASFELKSLIDGVVINRHVTLGEHLQTTDTAYVIADLTRLWLDIALYPKQLAKVKTGMAVHLTTAYGLEPVDSKIDYVAPLVNEATRTGLARVFLSNPDGRWKPGMFVTAYITLSDVSVAVRVPQTAVIDMKGQKIVFVREQNHWRAQLVKLGHADRDYVEVTEGLATGAKYAAEGGFFLKAQLEKDELESGHHH